MSIIIHKSLPFPSVKAPINPFVQVPYQSLRVKSLTNPFGQVPYQPLWLSPLPTLLVKSLTNPFGQVPYQPLWSSSLPTPLVKSLTNSFGQVLTNSPLIPLIKILTNCSVCLQVPLFKTPTHSQDPASR